MSSDAITTGAGQAPERKRNRRRFLAGAATGLAALGLGRLASGDPAMAADGFALVLGSGNVASHVTGITMDGTVDAPAFEVTNNGTGTSGAGVAIGSNGSGLVLLPSLDPMRQMEDSASTALPTPVAPVFWASRRWG